MLTWQKIILDFSKAIDLSDLGISSEVKSLGLYPEPHSKEDKNGGSGY